MESSINNIKSFSNERLVNLIEKIGHREAAKIIQEKKIDGQKILELTESETVGWKLTNFQRNLLWKCILHIKSNPLPYLDICHNKQLNKILNTEKTCNSSKEGRPSANLRKNCKLGDTISTSEVFTVCGNVSEQLNNRQQHPIPQIHKKKYFKFCQFKKQDVSKRHSLGAKSLSESSINRNSCQSDDSYSNERFRRFDIHEIGSRESFYFSCSSIDESVFVSPREHYYRESSEYIYSPCLEGPKDNTTVDRIRKYMKWIPRRKLSSENDELLKNSNHAYLELRNLNDTRDIPCSSKRITHIYEEPLVNTENSQLPKDKTTENPPAHLIFNLCCCSCYAGCTAK